MLFGNFVLLGRLVKIGPLLTLALLTSAIQTHSIPEAVREQQAIGERLSIKGRWSEAHQQFLKVLEKAESWFRPHLFVAIVHLNEEDFDEARVALEKAKRLSPNDEQVLYWSGVADDIRDFPRLPNGVTDEVAREIVQRIQDPEELKRLSAVLLLALEGYGDQRTAFQRIAEAFVDDRPQFAELWFDQWKATFSRSAHKVECDRGSFLLGQGREDEARQIYDRLVKASGSTDFVIAACDFSFFEHFGGSLELPKLLKRTTPKYPRQAAHQKIQGIVLLEGRITPDGRLVDPLLLSRPLGAGLDHAALSTVVEKWRFEPARLNRKPVQFLATVEVTFKLR